jgi:hypothetical protein
MEPYLPPPPRPQPPPMGPSGPAAPGVGSPPPFGGPGFATPGFGPGPYAPMPAPPRTPGLAVAALVCGIVGVFLFFFFAVLPILALCFGLVSGRQIATSGGRLKGKGFARTGVVLGVLGIIGFGVFAWAIATDRIDTDDKASSDELSVDDCLGDLPEMGLVFDDFEVVSCTEPHAAQVYFIDQLNAASDDPYPGETEVTTLVEEQCLAAFESYVGLPYSDSVLDVYYVAPSEAGWKLLDGEFTCIVYEPGPGGLTEVQMTETARNSGR